MSGRLIRKLTALFALLALAVSVSGCGKAQEISRGPDGKPQLTIMVGGLDKVIYLPAMLTERLGGFKRQGLDVKLLSQPSGSSAESALIAGEVAGVVGFYDHTIDLQAKKQCLQSVVQFANVPGEVEMVSAQRAGQIRGWKDMRDRQLGITSLGSSTDFLTKALANRAGLSQEDYTPVKVGAGQTFIASMQNEGIDAGMTTDPTVAQLTQSGQGKILTDMRTERGTRAALGGLYPSSSLYMNCQTVRRHPKEVQKLANALVETLGWMKTHSPKQIAEKMPASFASGGPELYRRSIEDTLPMFNGDGRMDPAAARNVLDVLAEFSVNVRPKKSEIDLGKTYTTRFVDRAAQR